MCLTWLWTCKNFSELTFAFVGSRKRLIFLIFLTVTTLGDSEIVFGVVRSEESHRLGSGGNSGLEQNRLFLHLRVFSLYLDWSYINLLILKHEQKVHLNLKSLSLKLYLKFQLAPTCRRLRTPRRQLVLTTRSWPFTSAVLRTSLRRKLSFDAAMAC